MDALLRQYRRMHRNPRKFCGYSTMQYVKTIAKLIKEYNAKTLLDYGSGKGIQYLKGRVHERWGGILPTCYDPGYIPLAEYPNDTFDGVICTDVMEHIEEENIHKTLKDIFNFANSFVFLGIATFPASSFLPDGRNCHVTIHPTEWWLDAVDKVANKPYEICYEAEGIEDDN